MRPSLSFFSIVTTLLVSLAASGILRADLPAGFQRVSVLSGSIREPIDIAWLPNGKLLVAQKDGRIRIVDPNVLPAAQTLYADLDAETFAEKGLESIVVDPDFQNSPYVYAYYHPANSTKFRVVRWMHDSMTDTALLGTMELLWEDAEAATSCCHFGGGLSFGPDECLYIGVGDEFDGSQSQSLTRHGGKILRIHKDGSIPVDNPFADGPGGLLDDIWALGLRNPFRLRWDLVDQRLYIGEVGGNDNSVSSEDVHLGSIGANYGWPFCEGDCAQASYNDPLFFYPHQSNGGSITGGEVYRGSVFPPEYQGAYFYGDYVFRSLSYATMDSNGDVTGTFSFEPNLQHRPVSIRFGPDGYLYYCHFSTNGQVFRIEYNASDPFPVIDVASADVTAGQSPLTVQFTGQATDPDDPTGSLLNFTWDFGDGNTSTQQSPSHVYGVEGPFEALLSVSDASSTVFSDPISIEVGTPPSVTINGPADGTFFDAGETIAYSATANEPGETFAESDYEWRVTFLHNDHTHPAGGSTGSSDTYFVPQSGHDYHDDTGYELEVTVTDSTGLQATDSVQVEPNKVDITFDSVPSGLPLTLDGIVRTTPFVYDTLVDFEHDLEIPESLCLDGRAYTISNWSDGETDAIRTFTIPSSNSTLVVNFLDVGPCDLLVTNGLVLHLDGEVGVTESGGVATAWADRSAEGNDMALTGGVAYDPAGLNGRPVLTFDGVDDEGVIATPLNFPLGATDRTMYVITRYNTDGYGGVGYGNTMSNEAFGLVVTNVGRAGIQLWGNDLLTTIPVNGAGWLIHSVHVESNSIDHELDGFPVDVDVEVLGTTQGNLVMGRELDGSPYVGMDVAEVILFDRALGDRERDQVLSYLNDKYFSTTTPEIGTRWIGSVNSTWTDASNWTNGVPGFDDDATIQTSAGNQPTIANGELASVANLTIEAGANLQVDAGGTLEVHGTVDATGGIVGGGTLELFGSGTIGATTIGPDVVVQASGSYMVDDCDVGGSFTLTSGTLLVQTELSVVGQATLTAGSIEGPGTFDVEGDVDWQSTSATAALSVHVAGNWTSGASADLSGATVRFDGLAQTVDLAGSLFGDVEVAAAIDLTNGPLAVTGGLSGAGGFAAGDEVALSSVASVASGFGLPNARVNTLSSVSFGSGVTVAGNLIVEVGELAIDGTVTVSGDLSSMGTLTANAAGDRFVVDENVDLTGTTLGSIAPNFTVGHDWTSDAGFVATSGDVRFATGLSALSGIETPEVSSAGSSFFDVTIDAGHTIDLVAAPLTFTGTLGATGATPFSAGDVVRMEGAAPALADGTNVVGLEVASSGTATILGTADVAEDLVHTSGTLDVTTELDIQGTAMFGAGTLTGSLGIVRVAQTASFTGTSLTTPPSIIASGDFTADASFQPGANFVRLDGPTPTLNAPGAVFAALEFTNANVSVASNPVSLAGDLVVTSSTFSAGTTFRFVGDLQTIPGVLLPNVEVASPGNSVTLAPGALLESLVLVDGTLEVDGISTVSGTATFSGGVLTGMAGARLVVAGDTTFNGTTATAPPSFGLGGSFTADAGFQATHGFVRFAGPATQVANVTGATFFDVDLDSTQVDVTGDPLSITGELTMSTSSFTPSSSLRFSGIDHTLPQTSLPAVECAASGNVVCPVGTTMQTLTLSSGTLSVDGAAAVLGDLVTTGGELTTAGGALFDIGGSASFAGTTVTTPPDLRVVGDWNSDANFAATSGMVEFKSGGANQDVQTTASIFFDVVLSSTTVATLGDPLSLAGDLVVTSNSNFDPGSTLRFVGTSQETDSTALPNVIVESTGTMRLLDGATILETLLVLSGAVELEGDVQVNGNATFAGGTLGLDPSIGVGAPVPLLSIAGDTSFQGTGVTVPPDLELAGAFEANDAFLPTSGVVTLTSPAATLTVLAPATSLTFFDLLLASGANLTLASDLALSADSFGVASGAMLDVATFTCTVDGAPIDVDGSLAIGSGGELELANAAALTVHAGATFDFVGASGTPAVLSGDGSEVGMLVEGFLDASQFRVERPGSTGFRVSLAATLGADPFDLRFGAFSEPSNTPGSVLLDIDRAAQTELSNLNFEDPGDVGTFNVRTAGPGLLEMLNAGGDFAGEDFDDDSLDLVDWSNQMTTIASFTATAGPELVTLRWTSGVEVDVQSFGLESALSPGGPWTPVFTTPPFGDGIDYEYTDTGLTADVEVFHRLVETVSGGQVNELGIVSATPWSNALPDNIVRVGPNGTQSTIQAAIDAATGPKTMLLVEPGIFAPFTIDGASLNGNLIIAGSVGATIDTTVAPIVIQNLDPTQSVEISDFEIGTLGGSGSPLVVSNADGVVILDDLFVESMTSAPAIDVDAATKLALQRSTLLGTTGVELSTGTLAAVSRVSGASIEVDGTSSIRECDNVATINVAPGGTQVSYPGQMPNFEIPERVPIGQTTDMLITADPGRFWQITYSLGVGYGILPNPRFEMVLLTDAAQLFFANSGVLDPTGQALELLPLPIDPNLVGSLFHMQLWTVEFVNPPTLRLSNLVTIVLTP